MALDGEIGWIGKNCSEHPLQRLLTKAMQSNAGWFIGTQCELCLQTDPAPNSRESEYYPSRQELVDAAFAGNVKWRTTEYKGLKLETDLVHQLVFGAVPEPVTDRYAVICPIHGRVFLTKSQYDAQMNRPGAKWACPTCGKLAFFDDDTYEKALDADEAADENVTGDDPGPTQAN